MSIHSSLLPKVTRQNVDTLLDHHLLQAEISPGRWWTIRRNGQTKHWKRDTSRVRVPFKAGLYAYGAIEGCDFDASGKLCNAHFRVLPSAAAASPMICAEAFALANG